MLEAITILYLFLPHIIFYFGWLTLFWAIFLTFLLSYLVIPTFRLALNDYSLILKKDIVYQVFITLVVAVAWTSLSGAGGWGFQNGDWIKHNAVLKDMIQHSWPVSWNHIQQESQTGYYRLIYYIAYYLPSALIGKMSSWQGANTAIFLWTLLGVWLSLLWFTKLTGAKNFWPLILLAVYFVLANGFGRVVDWFIQSGVLKHSSDILWWKGADLWDYNGNTVGLFWAPQHTLAGWLCSSLLLNVYFFSSTQRGALVIPFVAALLWSPFVAVGLIPLLAAIMIRHKTLKYSQFLSIVPALFFMLVFATYYHSLSYPLEWRIYTPQYLFSKHLVLRFILFYLINAGSYVLLLFYFNHTESEEESDKLLIFTAALGLFLIVLIRVGHLNDFCLRVSIPCLMILWVLTGQRLVYFFKNHRLTINSIILIMFIVLGSGSFLKYTGQSISHYKICPPDWRNIKPVFRINNNKGDEYLPRQYIGRKNDSLFFRVFGK